jgi:hypothetical protein
VKVCLIPKDRDTGLIPPVTKRNAKSPLLLPCWFSQYSTDATPIEFSEDVHTFINPRRVFYSSILVVQEYQETIAPEHLHNSFPIQIIATEFSRIQYGLEYNTSSVY